MNGFENAEGKRRTPEEIRKLREAVLNAIIPKPEMHKKKQGRK